MFWPYAYSDIFGYAFLPYEDYIDYGDYYGPFWAYGYEDLFSGVFLPYGHGAGHAEGARTRHAARTQAGPSAGTAAAPPMTLPCGAEKPLSVPISRIAEAVQPSPAQRAKLEALKAAEDNAANVLATACPALLPTDPIARLDLVQQRLEAMLQAIDVVRPALDDFYASLSDEQKARSNMLGESAPNAKPFQACGAGAGATAFPFDRIEQAVQPSDVQRGDLDRLRDSAAKAADIVKAACPAQMPLTPPGRLEAERSRVEAMLQAVGTVRPALETFWASLSDEQRGRFSALSAEQVSRR